jgi:hypothetical protein
MRVCAELRCYHCGYVAAVVEGARDQPLTKARLVFSTVGPGIQLITGQLPRCGRCGGPLFLDEVEAVRNEPVLVETTTQEIRRGRPPREALAR